MNFPAFSGNKPCVKCGVGSPRTLYVAANQRGSYGSATWVREDYTQECLQRTCITCGYEWLEAPLNGPPPAAPQAALFVTPDTEELQ
jgi:hypothetical protein